MTEIFWVMACTGTSDTGERPELRVHTSPDMATVALAHWVSDAAVGWVEFGPTEALGFRTMEDTAPTAGHDFVVVGVPEGETWFLRGVTRTEGGDVATDTAEFTAGYLDSALNTSVSGERIGRDWMVMPVIVNDRSLNIIDGLGRTVWQHLFPANLHSGAVRMSDDGQEIVALVEDDDGGYAATEVQRFPLSGGAPTVVAAPLAHHDFVLLPDGGYAWLTLDVRRNKNQNVVGDALTVVDAAGGAARVVWSAWDTFGAPDRLTDNGFYVEGADWTHANTVEYLPDVDHFVVSLRNLSTVLEIDRETGAVVRQFGGGSAGYAFSGTSFAYQHSPVVQGDTFAVFDNHDPDVTAVRTYAVDDAAQTLTETDTWSSPAEANVNVLGDVHPEADGAIFAYWGSGGFAAERDGAGEVVWRLDLDMGHVIGFGELLATPGGPAAP